MNNRRPIRSSQAISPFGVGAIIDFPKDEALIAAGLDAWPLATQRFDNSELQKSGWVIREERLEARLGVTHFRRPPDFKTDGSMSGVNLPFLRFPAWHYCHKCGGMIEISPFNNTRTNCEGRNYGQNTCAKAKVRPQVIPVRFLVGCENGHLQDFPFLEWAHKDKAYDRTHKLRLRAGRSSAGLAGITVECHIDVNGDGSNMIACCKKSLAGIFRQGSLADVCPCKGHMPWFGDVNSPCTAPLKVLQRGGSNLYFPQVVSSIYIPLWAEGVSQEIQKILEIPSCWKALSSGLTDGHIDPVRCAALADIYHINAEELQKAAGKKLEGLEPKAGNELEDEESYRSSEYEAIRNGKVGPNSELYVETMDIQQYHHNTTQFFHKIQLVHKLRETRALTGFTRIVPPEGSRNSQRLQKLALDPSIDWFPATRVFGEGIFLELSPEALVDWEKQLAVNGRIKYLVNEYNRKRTSKQQPHRNITPKFLLLHTLAHVLINQLAFDSGYGSSSIRERIYCDALYPDKPMQGILLYTASGDSEGSMGGLVRQGQPGRFELTLSKAIHNARWCSSDPICIESRGQGTDSANLAACHGCCLLPETSCEEGNRLLDRGMLIGTPTDPSIGFFNSLKYKS